MTDKERALRHLYHTWFMATRGGLKRVVAYRQAQGHLSFESILLDILGHLVHQGITEQYPDKAAAAEIIFAVSSDGKPRVVNCFGEKPDVKQFYLKVLMEPECV